MATRVPKPCASWPCAGEAQPGSRYCVDCGTPTTTVHHSPRWRRLRARILQRDPTCRRIRDGRPCGAPSTEVDHVTPVSEGGDPWAEGNLMGVCEPCHKAKSAAEASDRMR